jgi:hypothetical protein
MTHSEWLTGHNVGLTVSGLHQHIPLTGELRVGTVRDDGGVPVVPIQIGLDPDGLPVILAAPRPWLRAFTEALMAADARLSNAGKDAAA